MKTREELNALKAEVEAVNMKLRELSDEEMMQVFGGSIPMNPDTGYMHAERPDAVYWDIRSSDAAYADGVRGSGKCPKDTLKNKPAERR